MEWVQSENLMKSGLQGMLCGSCWTQYENWWNLVHGGAEGRSLQLGCRSSLPGEAGKWEQGIVAPFQERLVNEIRGLELPSSSGWRTREGYSLLQVGACVLVWVCTSTKLYEVLFIINIEDKDDNSGGFLPNWVSTLNTGVHVCCLCVMVYFVITANVYCLLNIWWMNDAMI